ncbi:unnamed protein product [Gadus morhua 'NCC']
MNTERPGEQSGGGGRVQAGPNAASNRYRAALTNTLVLLEGSSGSSGSAGLRPLALSRGGGGRGEGRAGDT